MNGKIIRSDKWSAVKSSDEEKMNDIESRRHFMKRFAVGIGTALFAPYFLLNDRIGRNLNEAQASDIAKRITSKQVGLKPNEQCIKNYCDARFSTGCPNTYCGSEYCADGDYCTSSNPYSCILFYGPTCSTYCGDEYCPQVYCSLDDTIQNCGTGIYCPKAYCNSSAPNLHTC